MAAINLLKSEACTPSQVAKALPPKNPCYTFYSYPTPPPAPSATPSIPKAGYSARNTFQATVGGARPVMPSAAPTAEPEAIEKPDEEKKDGEEKTETEESGEVKEVGEKKEETITEEVKETPAVKQPSTSEPAPKGKGRVIFIYTCPSGSPIKFRMVYSSGVRGVQQDAMDKANIEIAAKVGLPSQARPSLILAGNF